MSSESNQMTSRQRVRAALEHREPDRTPIFEYVMHSAVAEAFIGRPYAGDFVVFQSLVGEIGYESAVRRLAADMVDLAERLGFDLIYIYPYPPPAAASPPETESDSSGTHGLRDDPVEEVRRQIERLSAGRPGWSDAEQSVFVAVTEELARRGLDLPILAPAHGHGVWTNVDLMQTMLLEPEVAAEYFACKTRICMGQVEAYLELGIDQIAIGGDFAGNKPIISAEAYRTFIVPEVRKVARRIHEGGAFAVNASDGDLWYVIEDFLIGCEVDGYIEIDGQAGMDLGKLKQRFGDRITFYGNVDCMQVLSFAEPDEVRRQTHRIIEDGFGSGGHILCSNNAITSSVPVANYVAMQQAYREYFNLQPLKM